MSRFFRQAGDSSDSDSDTQSSDEELMSSDDEGPVIKPAAPAAKPTGMNRFLKGAGDSSSESSDDDEGDEDSDDKSDGEEESDDDEKPGIRILSAQEKRFKEIEATGKAMDNALKINDWSTISNGKYYPSILPPISSNVAL